MSATVTIPTNEVATVTIPEANGKAHAETNASAPPAAKEKAAKTPKAPKVPAVKPVGNTPDCPEGGEPGVMEWKDLTFDGAFQMRKELYNEDTVNKYSEHMADGDIFPELYVADTGVKKVVFSGFNRGEAYKRAGIKSGIPVRVWKMSEKDAKFWALRQNKSNALPRTKGDLIKTLRTVLDDEAMLKEICDKGEGQGGAQRSVAIACGVSNGLVWRELEERGVTIRGGKLVAKTKKPDATPEPGALSATPGLPTPAETPADPVAHHRQQIATGELAIIFHDALMQAAKLQRLVEGLLERKDSAELFAEKVKANNLVMKSAGEDGFERATIPAIGRVITALEESAEIYKNLRAAEQQAAFAAIANAALAPKETTTPPETPAAK